jgi:hypothetical protein
MKDCIMPRIATSRDIDTANVMNVKSAMVNPEGLVKDSHVQRYVSQTKQGLSQMAINKNDGRYEKPYAEILE